MKSRYITKQILLACRKKSPGTLKSIHEQLEETIAERRKIVPVWERLFLASEPLFKIELPVVQKDIHAQLAETIAAYKRSRMQSGWLLLASPLTSFVKQEKNAA